MGKPSPLTNPAHHFKNINSGTDKVAGEMVALRVARE